MTDIAKQDDQRQQRQSRTGLKQQGSHKVSTGRYKPRSSVAERNRHCHQCSFPTNSYARKDVRNDPAGSPAQCQPQRHHYIHPDQKEQRCVPLRAFAAPIVVIHHAKQHNGVDGHRSGHRRRHGAAQCRWTEADRRQGGAGLAQRTSLPQAAHNMSSLKQ